MKKFSLTTLVAAATLAIGGIAVAQTPITQSADAPSSTAGAGCTATGNAMRAGNLGGDPMATCNPRPAPVAVTPAPEPMPAPVAAAPAPIVQPAPQAPAPVAAAPQPAPEPAPAPVLEAKADRG